MKDFHSPGSRFIKIIGPTIYALDECSFGSYRDKVPHETVIELSSAARVPRRKNQETRRFNED